MSEPTNGPTGHSLPAGISDTTPNHPDPSGRDDPAGRTGPTSSRAPEAARKLREDAQKFEEVAAEIPRPFTSHNIVGSLAQTQELLADSLRDLAQWHENAQDGAEFEDPDGKGSQGAHRAAERLQEAATLADQLKDTLHEALDENGSVRWLDSTDASLRAERNSGSSWSTEPAPSPTRPTERDDTSDDSAASE